MSRSNPQLGLFGGLVLLATSLLGSSVFVVPVLGVQIAGQLINLLAYFDVFMVPMAMVFGQLGRSYPHAGGVSHWTARAMGPKAEWVIAMVLISVIPVGLPAALLLTMIFLERLFEIPKPWDLLAQLCVLAAVYGLNRAGVRASAWVQTAIILGSLSFIATLAFSTPVQTQATSRNWGQLPQSPKPQVSCCGVFGLRNRCQLSRGIPQPRTGYSLGRGRWRYVGRFSLLPLRGHPLSAGFESVESDALLQLASDRLGPVGFAAIVRVWLFSLLCLAQHLLKWI